MNPERTFLSKVAIVGGHNPVEMVAEDLELIEAEKAFKSEERILVKPNYINQVTHPPEIRLIREL